MMRFSPLVLLAAALPCQKSQQHIFPAESFACLRFAGLDACREAAAKMGMFRIGQQILRNGGREVIEQEFGTEIAYAMRQMHGAMRRANIEPAALRGVLRNGMAVAVGRPMIFAGQPIPSLALAIDVAGHEDDARKLVRVLEGMLMQSAPGVERTSTEIHGTNVTVLAPERYSGSVAHAMLGDYLVVTTGSGLMRDCIATWRGEKPSLADAAGFRNMARSLPGDHLASAYMNAKPFVSWLEPFMPYEAAEIGRALGVTGFDGIFIGTSRLGRGSCDVLRLGVSGPEDGLLRSAIGRPVSAKAARFYPDETAFFAAASVDPKAVIHAVKRFAKALPPEIHRTMHEEIGREISREMRGSGMSMERILETVSLLGPEVSIAVTMPLMRGVQPNLLAVVDVRDTGAAEQVLQQLLSQAPIKIRETRFQDHVIRYFNPPVAGIPYRPAFTFHDGSLVIGSDVLTLKGALKRALAGKGTLAQNAEFQSALRDAKGASMVAHLRLRAAVTAIWDTVVPMAENALASQIDVADGMFPSTEAMQENMSDMVLSLGMDDHGLTLKHTNPMGYGFCLATGATLLDWALAGENPVYQPAAKHARPAVRKAKAKAKPRIF